LLDVRIIAYVVPLAEQPQASLTPVITVQNFADEGAVITGLIRIYRNSSGLLIYTSRLTVTQLPAMTSTNISALTPFDPPTPADADYFIKADITATSYLPGPPLEASLGAWFFDIKTPAMGETPAGHHATHEDGGSDELDVTDLDGLLADAQIPLAHHTSHELGGDDEIDVTGLPGAGGGGTSYSLFLLSDFVTMSNSVTCALPWYPGTIGSGGPAYADLNGEPNHPGLIRVTSGTGAGSGKVFHLQLNALLLAGTERAEYVVRPQTLTNTLLRCGLHDSYTNSDPTDGVYLQSSDGLIEGKTSNNSTRSTTGTSYQMVTDTWYRLVVEVNSDATRVDFYVYSEAGVELWHDYLTANIPTSAGRESGNALSVSNYGTDAVALLDIDLFVMSVTRTFIR